MKGKVIAILETRAGAHLGELVTRRGGVALLAPALAEIPDIEPRAVADLLEGWRVNPYQVAIFQTGVGTRALFKATDSLGVTGEWVERLARALVVVRGPKPVGELTARQIRIDVRAPSPFTTETVLAAIAAVPLEQAPVLIQRYGAANEALRRSLEERGAVVTEIATYRWALPKDLGPLERLLDALAESRVDAVVFTSAVQIENLYAAAELSGRVPTLATHLNRTTVASIGPVCSRALRSRGVMPSIEADPPKLGPLLIALEAALT